MIKSTVGENLDAWIHRVFPFLFWGRLDPNTLTVIGALVSTAAAVALATGSPIAGGLLMLLGGFFDLTDGVVARFHGISTRFGAFLDSTLDRWVDVVLLAGIAVHFARLDELGNVALAGATTATMVIVSYSKARAELVLDRFEVGLLERAERVVILAAGVLSGYLALALWVILLGSAITAGQRFSLAYREMQRLDAADAAAEADSNANPQPSHSEPGT